jgi:hypothetical protein
MKGIEETKDGVRLIARFINACDESLADGKITAWDAKNFIGLVPAIKPALEGAKNIPSELAELDENEKKEVDNVWCEELDLHNDEIESLSEKGFKALTSFNEVAAELYALRQRRKAAQATA